MKNKNTIIILVLATIIFIGVFYYVKKTNKINIIPRSENTVVHTSEMKTQTKETEYLTFSMTYPVSSEEKFPELYSFIDEQRNDFMSDFNSLTIEDIKFMELGGDRKYDFTLTTRIATSTNTVTYIVEAYRFTGGAHGGTEIGTFTYDSQGKFLTLDSVLQGEYLNKLSTLSTKYFYDILGDTAQSTATEPNKENFSLWYLTPKEIVFIFGQYSVGPYAFGIHEFNIQKDLISNLLRPKFK